MEHPLKSVMAGLVVVSGLIASHNFSLAAGIPVSPVHSAGRQSEKSARPPKGATLLFSGKDLLAWHKRGAPDQPAAWTISNGSMEVGGGDIVTKEKFGDYQLHVEFQIPLMPDKTSQARGNSGVYQQGLFEVQVLDAYMNETYAKGGCASIYGLKDPDKNMAKPPLEWQSYDITFRASQFDASGKRTHNPRITVYWNGTKVHDNVEITCPPTASSLGGEVTATGPIMLQDHGCKVKYRNVWIKPLTSKAIEKALPVPVSKN